MNIGTVQIWTVDTFPHDKLHVGGTFLLEGKTYIVSQEEIDRINSLPEVATIVAQADQIMKMIKSGKEKLRSVE